MAWRFIQYVENLAALARTQTSLRELINELLSQRVRFENRLEERHGELTDPAMIPAAVALANRVMEAGGQGLWIPPCGGLDLALRRMVRSAGFGVATGAAAARVTISPADAGDHGLALVVFKALQIARARSVTGGFADYVAFDFETTDLDVRSCGVVEIGAVKVVGGQVVDRFHTLVRPERPISASATAVHGYGEADVAGAPTFAEAWPAFRHFIADQISWSRTTGRSSMCRCSSAWRRRWGVWPTSCSWTRSRSRGRSIHQPQTRRPGSALWRCRWPESSRARRYADPGGSLRAAESREAGPGTEVRPRHVLDWLAVALVLDEGARAAEGMRRCSISPGRMRWAATATASRNTTRTALSTSVSMPFARRADRAAGRREADGAAFGLRRVPRNGLPPSSTGWSDSSPAAKAIH